MMAAKHTAAADAAPDNRFFEQVLAGLSADFVFKGVYAGPNGRLVVAGNDGVVATQDTEGMVRP